MDVLQKLSGNTGKISVVYIKADDPAQVDTVIKELQDLPRCRTTGSRVWRSHHSHEPNNIPALRIFIRVVIGIAVLIGLP